MLAHFRACLWLLALTVVVCCVLYPLALWAVGQGLFRSQPEGSLVTDDSGRVRGSRLLAQKFSDERFFQPQPPAADYNPPAQDRPNLAASHPLPPERAA